MALEKVLALDSSGIIEKEIDTGFSLTMITDADVILATGLYEVGDTWTGSIFPGTSILNPGSIVVITTAGGTKSTQVYRSSSGTIEAVRYFNGFAWGLWSATYTTASLLRQSSSADTSAGVVLMQNAFGLGSTAMLIADANAAIYNGWYKLGTPYTNSPVAGQSAVILVTTDGTRIYQRADVWVSALTSVVSYARFYDGSSWSAWAKTLNTSSAEAADSGWLTPTLLNSWASSGVTPQYRLIGKRLQFRGQLTNAVFANNNTVAFNLPAAYRPPAQFQSVVSAGLFFVGYGQVTVATNGDVTIRDGSTVSGAVYASIDPITYLLD